MYSIFDVFHHGRVIEKKGLQDWTRLTNTCLKITNICVQEVFYCNKKGNKLVKSGTKMYLQMPYIWDFSEAISFWQFYLMGIAFLKQTCVKILKIAPYKI